MSPEETKERIKSVINDIIKGNDEQSKADFHDILAAKMRAKIQGEPEEVVVDPDAEVDPEVDPDPDAEVDTTVDTPAVDDEPQT